MQATVENFKIQWSTKWKNLANQKRKIFMNVNLQSVRFLAAIVARVALGMTLTLGGTKLIAKSAVLLESLWFIGLLWGSLRFFKRSFGAN